MTAVNEREEMTLGEVGGGTHFNAEIAYVCVAPEEEVAGIGGMAAELEQCHEIILRYGKLTGSDRTNGWMRKGCSRIDRGCYRRLQESIKTNKRIKEAIAGVPLTGTSRSMVKTFGSARNSAVALLMMYSACSSLIRPSR